MRARVAGVSVLAPGLPTWQEAQEVLAGRTAWADALLTCPVPDVLAPRERRRTSPMVRLALSAATNACTNAGLAPEVPDCIFASALGDGTVNTAILSALCGPEKLVSPTHFHNSVHNAAAGYWSQGVGSHAASTSLAAGDGSFGAALLKALLTTTVERHPVLLVCYDHPLPAPLHATRPVVAPFAVGLVLMPDNGDTGATISLECVTTEAPTPPRCEALRGLWEGCPPGRALPVLEGLLTPADVVVDGGGGWHARLAVSP